MASAHQPQHSYSHPPPPMLQNDVRLPSLKDLNFQYRPPPSQDAQSAPNGNTAPDHSRPRHDSTNWGRANAGASMPPPQHQTNGSAPHESPKTQYLQQPEGHYASPSMPAHQQGGAGMAGPNGSGPGMPRGDAPQNPMKRPHPESGVNPSVSPERSHASYPQHASYASQPPPPHHESVHQPGAYIHPPPPGYYAHPPPPHVLQRHYAVAPPPPPIVTHHPPPPVYSAPVPPEHWQQPPPPMPQAQRQYAPFPPRAPPPVQVPVDPRGVNMPPQTDAEKANVRQRALSQIYDHCYHLHQFAAHYAQLQATQPQAVPSQPELQEMTWRANAVVSLLDDLRRLGGPEEQAPREAVSAQPNGASPAEEHARPPKRPWEDDGNPASSNGYADGQGQYPDIADRSTAEADMEIIRSKRATSTSAAAPGQPKSKYRKRSRATPPGKCHSCNIRETPEWRRGPDGARTLCNACGLHYAKLMRKRDKGADGKTAPIDLQTLRASTQSNRGPADPEPEPPRPQPQPQPSHQQSPAVVHPPSYDQQKQAPPPMHHPGHPSPHPHQGSYQLMPVGPAPQPGQPHQMMPPPPPPSVTHSETSVNVPPPPWMTSASSGRTGYSSDHQSYLRTSHPPSHARASPQ
ncbi:uncharacterized protein LAESUDRAFT_484345 [Laetiporus sulphureus 93-53]|uniref:GATA-type domain-containing protein n=1 Tax=Laetiporus sulphureus 93-53 TaxID=1314785 RepID=A0A165BPF0_9APHY|nr:uncharacterized protein LAESUDRAFT_484345 [Laetiporus sulphureus 93-53]KZT01417.1 hypothetical protein LAESUDRAFT_484345 [Laetiporus sulphureus 93-53]